MANKINWKALEKETGTLVKAGLSANVIEMEKGDSFIGKYIGTEEVQIGDNNPFISLKFETEKGEQAISGVNLVQQMRMINIGSFVRVTLTDKKKAKKGKTKIFSVELIKGSINEKEREKIKKEISDYQKNKKKKSVKKEKK